MAEITTQGAEAHADRLLWRYSGKQHFYGDVYPIAQRELETRVTVKIAPTKVSLDAVFREGDIVSIHAPTTPETRHLVGAQQLALLRDGAIFVNCARSWVVDQDALLQTLQTGRIWAALDVFDQEPLPVDSPFRALPNVLLTPHQDGHTIDTNQQQGSAIVDEIERFFAGGELRYRISPESFALMA